jgi:hypothetical protein
MENSKSYDASDLNKSIEEILEDLKQEEQQEAAEKQRIIPDGLIGLRTAIHIMLDEAKQDRSPQDKEVAISKDEFFDLMERLLDLSKDCSKYCDSCNYAFGCERLFGTQVIY